MTADLIKQLEAAAEPSRELDYKIADAVLGPVRPPLKRGRCEHYTSSIDAALTLVPADRAMAREYLPCATWPVRVYLFKDGGLPGTDDWPRPTFDGKPTKSGKIGVLAKSEPIALCIAALRAHTGKDERHGE